MLQKTLMALALATSVFAAGCGGSSDSTSSGSGGGSTTTARNDVAGPLDALQEPVSSQVLAPLADAAAGTPLEGVVMCVDQIVVGDTLDIADTLAGDLDASTGFPSSAADVEAEVTNLMADLQGLLTSLAGGSGCSGSTIPAPGGFDTNPLVGTPLEDFGATLLSTLTTVQSQLEGSGSGTPSLSTLNSALLQLSTGYELAVAQLPADATTAPVLGPSLDLISVALADVQDIVAAAAAGNPTTTGTAITTTVTDLLDGLLLGVVPITEIEDASGQTGAISGPIADALAQLSAALAGGFTTPGTNLLPATLADELDALLAPLTEANPGTTDPTVVLNELLVAIQSALGSGDMGGLPAPDVGSGDLNDALGELSNLLSAGSITDPTGLLDSLVTTLEDLIGLLGII